MKRIKTKGRAATVGFPRLARAACLPMRSGADHSGFDSYPFISIHLHSPTHECLT
jgi:hypothetical protein